MRLSIFCALLGVFLAAPPVLGATVISDANFPDAAFRAYVSRHCDSDHDGALSHAEIQRVKVIDVNGSASSHEDKISSLKGIERFTALISLNCRHNSIEELDLMDNRELMTLNCDGNKLEELNLYWNKKLVHLNCSRNRLTELDLTGNRDLTFLDCSDNELSELRLGKARALKYLDCSGNQMTRLNLSESAELASLICRNNRLLALDVSRNLKLRELWCSDSGLAELDVSGNMALTSLHCSGNSLANLDLSQNKALQDLRCTDNRLTSLDLSVNASLRNLSCSGNRLAALDLRKNRQLNRDMTISQTVFPLTATAESDGAYRVELKTYVARDNLKHILKNSVRGYVGLNELKIISYDPLSGTAKFPSRPTRVSYQYDTGAALMKVAIEAGESRLDVAALERGRGDSGLDNIIEKISASGYYNASLGLTTEKVTEAFLAKFEAEDYGKKGLAADGNARLIMRVRPPGPGSVAFTIPPELEGARLERLMDRAALLPGDSVETVSLHVGKEPLYQASAVLIAPRDYPPGMPFPAASFDVIVDFRGRDGAGERSVLTLSLCAAPVVMVHGIYGYGPETFGREIGKEREEGGIYKILKRAYGEGLLAFGNYDRFKGPSELIGEDRHSVFFENIARQLDRLNVEGVACTRVDLVTHSMGGLMARRFLAAGESRDERAYGQRIVRRLITVATPHEGSPWPSYLLGNLDDLNLVSHHDSHHDAHSHVISILRDDKIRGGVKKALKEMMDGNGESAWRDLALNSSLIRSLREKKVPVPIHIIYGVVGSDMESLWEWTYRYYNDKTSEWTLDRLRMEAGKLLYNELAALFKAAPELVESEEMFRALLDVIFNGEDSDVAVSESSARAIVGGNEAAITKYPTSREAGSSKRYNHVKICHQDDVGERVLALLKGPEISFDISGVSDED
ncbi:MAG: hypothetical protein IJR68_08545 [Fretibacterium sp.]|nr:hypothetical protein [Fretibacterium sp.]